MYFLKVNTSSYPSIFTMCVHTKINILKKYTFHMMHFTDVALKSNTCYVSWTQVHSLTSVGSLLLFSLQFVVDSACLFETFLSLDSTVWLCCGWSACCVCLAYRGRSHRSGGRRGGQRQSNHERVKVISLIQALCVGLCICVCVWGVEAKEEDERGKARPRVGEELHVNILRATGLILGNICLSW